MVEPLHVLLVDNNLADAEQIADLLENSAHVGYQVTFCDRLETALEHLKEHHTDVVLLELELPDSHGLETFRRTQQVSPQLAIIVLSGRDDANVAMRAVRDGAQGYLVKNQFDSTVLDKSIQFAVEKSETRRALLESEARYLSMVESLPMNLFRKDLDGRIVFGNRRFCDTLGAPLERLLGKSDYDLFPAELAAQYVHDDRRVIETGEIVEDIEEHVGPDGELIYVHVMKSPIRDAANKIIGIQGIFWDVSDRKRAESALLEERHLLRSLMDNLPDPIFFKDRKARFLRVNKALADLFQLDDPEQAIGRTDHDFFPSSDASGFLDDERQILETGEPLVNREEHQKWPDGHESWSSTTKMPLRDRHGKIIGTFGISRDISHIKRVHEQLRQAKEEAESANRAKGHFLANISHEVRTPMNAILGLAELLLQTPLSDEQQNYLELVQESGEALLGLLNDVLDFSKIEAGRLELETTGLDIRTCLDDTLKMLAASAHQKGLELVCHVDSQVPSVVIGDNFRFRQILANLVGNAIKFTSHGEVVVAAALLQREHDLASIEFTVRDTGIGIAANKLPQIFNAFEQADGSTTRQYGGTGLGLTIASEMVQLMGGDIGVESTVGSGTCFRFVIPYQVPPAASKEDEPTSPLSGSRVLVVDDNEASRLAVVELLKHEGIRASSAADAGTALSQIRKAAAASEPFAAVFCDIAMPDIDSFELVRQIRDDEHLSPAVIMMLTVDGFASDIELCRANSVNGHLMKPVKQSDARVLLRAKFGESSDSFGLLADEVDADFTVGPLRILVAEDDKVNQMLIRHLLEQHGHDVVVVNTGLRAVEESAVEPFDLIVMDLQMPEMDGLAATKEIRRRETGAGRRVPIVALTAHALDSERDKCLAGGMDGYLTKPLRSKQLFAIMKSLVAEKSPDADQPPLVSPRDAMTVADWDTALAATNGDRRLLSDVIDVFVSECPKQLAALRESIETRRFDRMERAAHTLKGSVVHFGAAQAVATAEILETMGVGHQTDGADEVATKLEQELAAVRSMLDQFKSRCLAVK